MVRRLKAHTRSNTRGFTLIELLVVVTIIGLLALISLPRFARTREKAYRAQMQTALRTLVTAQESYFDNNMLYADDLSSLKHSATPMVSIQIVETSGNGWSADATHDMTAIKCGLYVGPVSPISGVPDDGDGIISCSAT